MTGEKIKCIYAIKDMRSDNIVYIGKTKNFKQRKYAHFGHKESSVDLYMFKQGRENFEIIIIQKYTDNDSDEFLRVKEQEYIEKYDTIKKGLNKNKSGNVQSQNPKKYLENYRISNKDKLKEKHRTYYNLNKSKIQERQKLWNDKNEEHLRQYQHNYYLTHKDKYLK